MFATQMEAAIASTRSLARLDDYARDVWRAMGAGALSEDAAGLLSERIEAQRREIRPRDTVAIRAPEVARRISVFPQKRKRPRCPDRAASIARRRTLAASGVMPPALASMFTTGELAALRIVADEVRSRKACELTIGEIAARAGCSETIARGAIRAAAAAGLLLVIERRQHCAPNLPNVVRVISREWLSWMAKRPAPHRQGGGFGNVESTDRELIQTCSSQSIAQGLAIKTRGEPEQFLPRCGINSLEQ